VGSQTSPPQQPAWTEPISDDASMPETRIAIKDILNDGNNSL